VNQSLLVERYRELAAEGRAAGAKETGRPLPAAPAPNLGSTEERDLAYFLVQGQAPAEVIAELRADWFAGEAYRRLVDLAKAGLAQQGRVEVRPLLDAAMADPVCAPIVRELSLAARHFDDPKEHLQGCVQTLKRKQREAALRDVVVQLRAAEREGRSEDVERLNALVNELRLSKAGAAAAPQ
jgi:hypothetical protein